jgi:predicted heme/steroid binding protein
MDIPDIVITDMKLRRNNGDKGAPKWIAHDSIVYDVSECPKWRKEMHENLHFPGQDLTIELADAPHSISVFLHPCIKIVGRLEK